jgi:hypothetical protein
MFVWQTEHFTTNKQRKALNAEYLFTQIRYTVTEYQVKDILKVRNIKCRYKWLVVVAVSEIPMSEAK